MKSFDKIKSLQNKLDDILNDNDSLKNKVKSNIRNIYLSMHNIAINLTDKEQTIQIDDKIKEDKNQIESEGEEGYNFEKQIKIGKTKTEINEYIKNMIIDIKKLHKEHNLNNYADIYITFRNQLIPKLLYDLYNKGKIIRFFYFIFCRKNEIEKYYYKEQWLNFNLAKENPSDIKWENCYISSIKKFGRRFLSIFISLIFLSIIVIIMVKTKIDEDDYNIIIRLLLPQIITLFSSFVLGLFTKFEKYSSISKEIFSDISKNFWLNFLVYLTVFCKKENFAIFSYREIESYFVFNEAIIMNVLFSSVTAQLSPLVFYILNLFKRFSDSKFNNGKTTQLKTKIKYEELYLGPEFPFQQRYSTILVNLSLTLLYGSNCPVIYFFFIIFLIVTFLVDKFLMIFYYKKPPLYGELLSKKMISYFFFCSLLYFYGLFYNISNPYIFNNYLLKWNTLYERYSFKDTREIFSIIYYVLNPITLLYLIVFQISEEPNTFKYYNFNSDVLLVHFFVFVLVFLNPISFIKKKVTPKSKFISLLNTSPLEIGTVYTFEELKKYYEIKKLQLINLINDCDTNDKVMDNYSHLINNYMFVLKYIKQNIDTQIKKNNNLNNDILDNNNDENSPLKFNEIISHKLHLTGDLSYNQSFIPRYEIYNNFSLVKNL